MAEHLTPSGRAAIIVPEGIIFQSGTAYKQLRKMLVDTGLVAVISLPAGVFQPYSGVKTSIIILDKSIARDSNSIAFFKVDNDGFGLGAQRRAIKKNDLPIVVNEIAEYLGNLRGHESVEDLELTQGLIVPKKKIAENGDYNLSGERYREGVPQSTKFPWIKIDLLVDTITPPVKIQKTAFNEIGRFPIIDQSQDYVAGWTDDEFALVRPNKPLVIFGDHTCAVKLVETPFAQGADGIKILQTVDNLDPRFLYFILKVKPIISSGYQRHFSKLKEYEIPLPPLEVQKEIVTEIEAYQKVIDGARAVIDNYRPHILIHPDWPMVELGKILKTSSGGTPLKGKTEFYENGTIPWLKSGEVGQGLITTVEERITESGLRNSSSKIFPVKTVLVAMYGATAGKVGILGIEAATNQAVCGILPDSSINSDFLFYLLKSRTDELIGLSTGGAQPNISQAIIRSLLIPLPPLETQQSIVAEIEAEQLLVAANRELIERFEKKIQATIARIWGEEESDEV
jgi:type I restriction enzyme M protein